MLSNHHYFYIHVLCLSNRQEKLMKYFSAGERLCFKTQDRKARFVNLSSEEVILKSNFENHALKFPHLSVFCVFLFSIQQETNCTKRWQSTWGIKKLISWKMTWLSVTFCAAEFECYFFIIMLYVKAWINVTKRLRGDSDVDGTCIPQVWILHLAC